MWFWIKVSNSSAIIPPAMAIYAMNMSFCCWKTGTPCSSQNSISRSIWAKLYRAATQTPRFRGICSRNSIPIKTWFSNGDPGIITGCRIWPDCHLQTIILIMCIWMPSQPILTGIMYFPAVIWMRQPKLTEIPVRSSGVLEAKIISLRLSMKTTRCHGSTILNPCRVCPGIIRSLITAM